MSNSFMDNNLSKTPRDRIKELLAACRLREHELSTIMRGAMRLENEYGKPISISRAQTVMTISKRDKLILEAVQQLLLCIEPSKFQMSSSGYKGLERLLYPVRRHYEKEVANAG